MPLLSINYLFVKHYEWICDLFFGLVYTVYGFNSAVFHSVYPVDHVFEQILHSSSTDLAEAKKILEKIISRKHYKFLGEIRPGPIPTKVCINVFGDSIKSCIIFLGWVHLCRGVLVCLHASVCDGINTIAESKTLSYLHVSLTYRDKHYSLKSYILLYQALNLEPSWLQSW